ncbi:MAG: prolipoprotein diacylglyceryl transferase [Candidatus Limnocylindrales bacterium]
MPFVIDIDPVAFSVLGIQVRWYGLILVLAISVAVWIAQRVAGRRGISSKDVSDGAIWVGAAALIGGRLLFVIQNDLQALGDHPAHLLMVWMGGLSFYGGLIGGAIALAVFARRRGLSLLVVLDVAAPAAAIGQAIGHIGCLIGGDSFGLPTAAPWAVIYRNPAAMAPQGIPLHPTQAYEAILLALLFAAIWLASARLQRLGNGVTASTYLLGLAVIRFGLFFLRDEAPVFMGLKTAQWLGVVIAVAAVVVFIVARDRARSIEVSSTLQEGSIS